MPSSSSVGASSARAEALRQLQELRSRTDVAPGALESQVALAESRLGVMPQSGRTVQQRIDDLILKLGKTAFEDLPARGPVALDVAPSKPARAQQDLRELYLHARGVDVHHAAPARGGSLANVVTAELSNGLIGAIAAK
jgi:hypothetical protein